MVKKIFCVIMIALMMLIPIEHVEAVELATGGQSAILMDYQSGQILYSKNDQDKLYPASTTKIMTMILLFEAIEKKILKWDDILTCSQHAASMGGSQIYLEENETMSVDDLFKSIAIASANDACVVVGEAIAGSHEKFVEMMNDKVKELNLSQTHFKNATGLHDSQHYTCARDLAMMAHYLIKIGQEKLFSVTTLYDAYIREDSDQKFWLVNTNKLLKQYQGVDGLKTGYTKEAGYCIVTTCLKDNMRLIGVLMKEEKPKTRNEDMCGLLNYGYSHFQRQVMYKKGDIIDKQSVDGFDRNSIDIVCREDISYLQNKGDHQEVETKITYHSLELPIDNQKEIGKISLIVNQKEIASYSLYSQQTVEKQNYFQRVYKVYRGLM